MAFIKQEAMEKAREIKVKADEEFAIEKVSMFSLGQTKSTDRCVSWKGKTREARDERD